MGKTLSGWARGCKNRTLVPAFCRGALPDGGTVMRIRARALAIGVVAIVPLLLADVGMAGASTASTAKTYVVVLKGNQKAGLAAIQQAGGRVLKVNKLGIGQVSSENPSFIDSIRRSGAVDAAANDAARGWSTPW